MLNEEKLRIGIDIGGTSIKMGLVDQYGKVLSHRETETPENPEDGLTKIKELIGDWLIETDCSIGLAAPGPVDIEKGMLLDPPNLKGWHNFKIVEQFEKQIGVSCLFENDANAAAVGEYHAGAGQGSKSMVYITISTGIGAGIVLNGDLLSGAQFSAGEVGNMIISDKNHPDRGMNAGAWEMLASGTAIGEKVSATYQSHGGAKELLERVNRNEEEALQIFHQWIDHLASGIANIVHVINPEVIVLGGGVMQGKDTILPKLIPAVKAKVYDSLKDSIHIRHAELSTKAGVIGASFIPVIKRF